MISEIDQNMVSIGGLLGDFGSIGHLGSKKVHKLCFKFVFLIKKFKEKKNYILKTFSKCND
jgi:hypothetical protein